MRINHLSLKNFRSYDGLELPLGAGISLFSGENAQGKTNILEAAYYSALCRSHRTGNERDMVKKGTDCAALSLAIERRGVPSRLDFQIFASAAKRRKIILNGQPTAIRNLIGTSQIVFFSPEDLSLVKGAPALRRRWLDAELSQASKAYFSDLDEYQKALDQRNGLLKLIRDEMAAESDLAVWDEAVAIKAARVVRRRLAALEKLAAASAHLADEITGANARGEKYALAYEIHTAEEIGAPPPLPEADWYLNALKKRRRLDIGRGSTSIGPHRDDLVISVNEMDLRSFGSQGQQRTGAIALKLSELELLKEESGEYPVLLLDDVMSELDKGRRAKLLSLLAAQEIQALITATDRAYFDYAEARGSISSIYEVRNSEVRKIF